MKASKKWIVGATSAALVASAIVPVASAASFSDIENSDHKDAILALAEAGIISGYTDGTFKPNAIVTRGNVTKLLGKWLVSEGYEIPADYNTVERFTDLPVTAADQELVKYAALVKDAGVFKGSNNQLMQANNMTREQMAVVLVRALNTVYGVDLVADYKAANFESKITDLEKATADENREAIIALEYAELTTVTAFNPKNSLTRGQFASFLNRAITNVAKEEVSEVKVESVTAVTSKSLKVTFNTAVDTSKATFDVKKGTVKVNTSSITWNESKTEAVIELAGKLTKGEYTVNVTGLSEETLTATATVEDEKVSKIEILSEQAPLVDADSDSNVDDLQVGYRVLNQYGEDITKTTTLTTSAENVKVDPANGTVTIVGDFDTTINKLATFTLIHASTATTATTTVTAVSEAKISEVSVVGIYNKDGKTLTETTKLASDLFYVELEVKDQYGNVINDATKVADELLVTESNSLVVKAATKASVITVDGKKKVVVALSGTPTVGKNIVTVISKASGKSASTTVEVAESVRAYNVDIQAPELAVMGETVYLPVVVTDKEGKVITDLTVLKDATRGIKVTQGTVDKTNDLIVKDGAVVLPTTLSSAFESFVILSNATQKVDTLTVETKAAAKPTTVTGLKSTFSTTLKAGATPSITTANLQIEDQYGREMTQEQIEAWLSAAETNEIVVSSDADNDVITSADGSIKNGNTSLTVTAGKTNGSEVISIVLKDKDGVITSSTKEVTLRVTDGSEYVSYEVEKIGTIYDEVAAGKTDAEAYDKEIKVYGVLADGSKVQLSTGEFAVTSSNATLQADAADGTLDVDSAYTYTVDDKDVTEIKLPLTVTINATGEQFDQEVTLSKVAPKVTAVTVVADGKGDDVVAGKTVSNLTSGNFEATGAFTFADTYGTFADVVVTDQYGAQVVITGTDEFADGTEIAAPTVTFTKVSGDLVFTKNGLADASVTELPLNSAFKFVLNFAGTKSDAVEVKVTKAYSATGEAAENAAAALKAINDASSESDIGTALTNHASALGISLDVYNLLPEASKTAVNVAVYNSGTDYDTVEAVKTAFNDKVSLEKVDFDEVTEALEGLSTLSFDDTNNATHTSPKILVPTTPEGITYKFTAKGETGTNGGDLDISTGDGAYATVTRSSSSVDVITLTLTATKNNVALTKVFNVTTSLNTDEIKVEVASVK